MPDFLRLPWLHSQELWCLAGFSVLAEDLSIHRAHVFGNAFPLIETGAVHPSSPTSFGDIPQGFAISITFILFLASLIEASFSVVLFMIFTPFVYFYFQIIC